MKRGIAVFVPIGLILGALTAGQAQDVITKKDGSTMPVPGGRPIRVTSETVKTVKYKMQGISNELSFPARDIRRIAYERQPEAYTMGQASFDEKDYATAAGDFEEAIKRGGGFHWVKQNALYKIALCNQNMGAYNEAVSAYRQLLKEVPNTRFLPQAHLGIIQSIFLGKGAKGEVQINAAVKKFEKAISRNGLGRNWKYDAAYWKLQVQNAKGADISAAAKALSRDAAEDNPNVANKAKILIGLNLLRNPTEAQTFFRNVLRDADENQPGVKAAGYCGLGICIYKLAPEKDLTTFDTAKELFLRSIVLSDKYPQEVERDITVRALFYAGRCFAILRRQNKHNTRHARDLFREVIKDFPGTDWAIKADKELKKL